MIKQMNELGSYIRTLYVKTMPKPKKSLTTRSRSEPNATMASSNPSGSSLATSTRGRGLRDRKVVNYADDNSDSAEERPKKPRVTTTAKSKRKCDDSDEDDSDEDDDDSDEDDDAPPSPKKCGLLRQKRRIKDAVLPVLTGMIRSNDKLLAPRSFVDKHWKQLYGKMENLGNDDDLAQKLLLSSSKWRYNLLGHARDLVEPTRIDGHASARHTSSALGRGENAPFTPTINLSVVELGHFVNAMEQLREGNDDFVPHPDVAACFPIGDMDLAMEYALLEHDSW